MERADEELLKTLVPSNPTLKKLYQEHQKLDRQVERFEPYTTYSTDAARRQKELKIKKLRGMEEIMSILKEHKAAP